MEKNDEFFAKMVKKDVVFVNVNGITKTEGYNIYASENKPLPRRVFKYTESPASNEAD
jgi:hypothetical protein